MRSFCRGCSIMKIIDITRKNKNVIPTVESHKTTLIFTNAGINDIFYRLWNAGLGECDVWYNEGSEPSGQIYNKKVKDMIDRGINASAGMLIVNPNARNTAKIGMGNDMFRKGSIHYVGSEIRAVILNKMMVDTQDDVCVMQNVTIIDRVDEESMKDCPVPSLVFMVASASMEKELAYLTKLNPQIRVVIYTLDFQVAAGAAAILEKFGIGDVDTIQIAVSRLGSNHAFKQQPAPWIITGHCS